MNDGIDYEKLAKAAYEAPNILIPGQPYESAPTYARPIYEAIARAVVAALAEQGLVVTSRDDLAQALSKVRFRTAHDPEWPAYDRLVALSAPRDGGEDRDG